LEIDAACVGLLSFQFNLHMKVRAAIWSRLKHFCCIDVTVHLKLFVLPSFPWWNNHNCCLD